MHPSTQTISTSVHLEVLGEEPLLLEPERIRPLASVGKVLLLVEVARQLHTGGLERSEALQVAEEDRTLGGSGILGSLTQERWEVGDLAVLVAAHSDNAATNMLLRRVGLEAVQSGALDAGLERTQIHDMIRPGRGPGTPPQFATGTVGELGQLLSQVARRELHSPEISKEVHDWMRLCTDRSLVADSVRHDPHSTEGVRVANKTGTDTGVRADVGILQGKRTVVYAVVTTFPAGAERSAVLQQRHWGAEVERRASGLS